jgi:hypothetical protein
LAGDTRTLSERLAQGPGASEVAPGDRQLQRELAKLYGCDPSFGTAPDEALSGYLDELERLCAAATPGPWFMRDGDVWCCPSSEDQREYIVGLVRVLDFDDGAFVAAARHALPKLVAKVRELQARIAKVNALGYEFHADPATALRCIGEYLELAEHYDRYPNAPRQE